MPNSQPAPKAEATPGEGGQGIGSGTSHLPWHLIPSFKPGDDINEYTRRLEFLANVWPPEHLAQLAPRACLQAEGAAFQKLVRLDPTKLKVQNLDGIKLVVSTLGGTWGQSKTEHKYERFERAIYSTIQKSDETYSSYVARHEVQYEDMLTLGATLEEMRAYILLRNSGLDPEDKKRIIVDAQGKLEYDKIVSAIQLLGSRFFGEVQSGTSKSGIRTKNYDINYVDTAEEEAHHVDSENQIFVEPDEEQIIDVLLAEGDEDALILQQFEEALIESLQGDPDIAACLNTYVEARRKLQDKARSRGFWNSSKSSSGFKGKGRGGKNKGGFSQNFGKRRLSLAQRILNSHCAICHQKGHWKAECPSRDRSDSSQKTPSTSAFAGVTMTMIDEGDDYHDPTLPPPEQAVAFMATTQDSFREKVLCRSSPEEQHRNKYSHRFDGYKQKIDMGLQRINWGKFREKINSLTRMTAPHMTDPLIRKDVADSTPNLVEQAYFVSEGSLGIVDLGASLSVIGQSQFDDLCKHLPKQVLQSMKETPCQVRFRFGNDSSVTGTRAIFFPVGAYWIKVVVVPSNTPFLIANSVFRALGAVIDTEEATIFFKKLNCRLPIQLSDRRLYRLDLVQLLTCCPPQKTAARPEQIACHTIPNPEDHPDTQSLKDTDMCNSKQTSESDHSKSLIPIDCASQQDNIESQSLSRSEDPAQSKLSISQHHGPVLKQGLIRSTGRSPEGLVSPRGRSPGPEHHPEDDLRRAQGREDRVWQGTQGPSICGNAGRNPLPDMVFLQLQEQSEAKPCQVSSIPSAARRECGEGHQGKQAETTGQISGQGEGSNSSSKGDRDTVPIGGRGLRDVGSCSPRRSSQPGSVAASRSHATDGEPPTSSGRTFEPGAVPCKSSTSVDIDPTPSDSTIADTTQQAFLSNSDSLIPEPSMVIDPDDVMYSGETVCYCRANNWVAKEMWEYMRTKGVDNNSSRGRQIRSELIEIYCSQDSQLTNNMQKLNGDAERFGLRQGDLSTRSGRCRLYDRLLIKQPGCHLVVKLGVDGTNLI